VKIYLLKFKENITVVPNGFFILSSVPCNQLEKTQIYEGSFQENF